MTYHPNNNRKDVPNRNIRRDSKDSYVLEPLRNARLDKGYTTYHVAREVGITPMSYNHYERLRTVPTLEHAQRVSELLQRPQEYLFPPCLPYLVQLVTSYRKQQDFLPSETPNELPEFLPLYDLDSISVDSSFEDEDPAFSIHSRVHALLQHLTPRQRDLLIVRYGLNEHKEICIPSEAARRFGFSPQNARQLEERALSNLREIIGSTRSLADYLLSMR